MNDRQRQQARRKKHSGGYADGGIVGAASRGIERVGRALNTDKGKKLKEVDAFLAQGNTGTGTGQAIEGQRKKAIGVRRMADIEEAEQKALGNYAGGGKVTGKRAATKHSY